jgi:acyl-CoA reductase-like NAD-dependent aldehyde dehydrogenase
MWTPPDALYARAGGSHVQLFVCDWVANDSLEPTSTVLQGGKNPCIVDGEASEAVVRRAAYQIVWGRLMNAGQQCIAPDYVLCW